MAKSRRIRFFFEYLLYRFVTILIAMLPRSVALASGAALGRLAFFMMSERRLLAEQNMQRALPELSRHQVRSEVAGMFRHLGIIVMELLMLKRFHDESDLSRYFDFENLERLQEAHARGKGVLLVTAHLGFWEAGTFFLPKLGFPVAFIAKRMKNPRMDSYLAAIRVLSGGEIIDARRGARKIIKALGQGKVVCVLPDQHNRDGEMVDFFGHPARTTTMVAQLAMKTGAVVLPGFTLRTPDNRYRSYFDPPVEIQPSDDPDAVLRYTEKLNKIIEEAIRNTPSQWFWLHRRWRD